MIYGYLGKHHTLLTYNPSERPFKFLKYIDLL